MTPFLQFCLQYPEHLHLENKHHQFWCGDALSARCTDCPRKDTAEHCNTLFEDELAYIQIHLPELLV